MGRWLGWYIYISGAVALRKSFYFGAWGRFSLSFLKTFRFFIWLDLLAFCVLLLVFTPYMSTLILSVSLTNKGKLYF